jgi:hypothetical protein
MKSVFATRLVSAHPDARRSGNPSHIRVEEYVLRDLNVNSRMANP